MTRLSARLWLVSTIVLGIAAVAFTAGPLASAVRFGLEFRGGYEIYYVVGPGAGKTEVTPDDLLKTTDALRARADKIGMSEPEIKVEGANHIRVRLAGLTSAEESRSMLGSSAGLPTTLTEKYTQTVGSVLGSSALKETLHAGVIGIASILLMLVVLYRGMGVIAGFATLGYLWLLVILFNAAHATLSLSAVVAFVLGLGMAADASIICFERVREELGRGHGPADAVRLGFAGSFATIRDANLVTALAMGALFVAGIGPIQGFSLTMLGSLVISVVTNFFGVRLLGSWLARAEVLPVSLLVGSPRQEATRAPKAFVRFGGTALLASTLAIAAGALYFRTHGMNLDIDFTAGTALDIDLDRAIDQDTATAIMTAAGTVPATVAIGGDGDTHVATRFDDVLKPDALKPIIAAFQAKYSKVEYEENTADPAVARDFATRAVYATLAAFTSIALYIGWRFSWSIALATVVAIAHDIALVSAIFALFKLEIDVTYVAAILTIIGYSLNDKIVIFGRIRENERAGRWTDRQVMIDASIQQTLGRSIYTVMTVVAASAALYGFACEPLQMFALAILFGLISGAYSSIFLSTTLWLTLRRRPEDGPVQRSLAAPSLVGLGVCLGASGAFIFAPTPDPVAVAAKSSASVSTASNSPLGDLNPYRAIADDTLRLVESGAPGTKARERITDLESAWDEAEESMRPLSPSDWSAVDKAIDRALAKVRTSEPVKDDCVAALKTLLAKMDSLDQRH